MNKVNEVNSGLITPACDPGNVCLGGKVGNGRFPRRDHVKFTVGITNYVTGPAINGERTPPYQN